MSKAPEWFDRKTKLRIGMQLIADGLFQPVYQSVEKVIGTEKADELLAWAMSEKAKQEDAEANPPEVTNNAPTVKESLTVGEIDILANASWGPKKEGKPEAAKITTKLSGVSISGGQVRFSHSRNWPVKMLNGTTAVNAVIYIGVQDGATWRVSKFDWLRPGQSSKTLHNISTGYTGLAIGKGSKVVFVVTSTDGKERSNASQVLVFP
jgi:hypothetical protein